MHFTLIPIRLQLQRSSDRLRPPVMHLPVLLQGAFLVDCVAICVISVSFHSQILTATVNFLVPVVGVEPTRVISTRDFESPSSAIPTHRLIVYVIIAYLEGKIKRKVSLPPRPQGPGLPRAAGGDCLWAGAAGQAPSRAPGLSPPGPAWGRAGHGGTAFLFVVPAPFSLRPKAAFHFTSAPAPPGPAPAAWDAVLFIQLFLGGLGQLFFKKTLQMNHNFILYR